MYTCKNCNQEFRPQGSRGKFCSRQCYWEYLRTKPQEYRVVQLVTLTCGTCGKVFERRRHEVRSKQSYCSIQCAAKANGPTNARPELRKPSIEMACQMCGKSFKIKASKSLKRRFCSRLCDSAFRTKYMVGASNPNHRHGQSQGSARTIANRFSPDKCIVCGWDISTDVHHITPKAQGGTNDPYNLAVLCPNHHRMAKLDLISADDLRKLVKELIMRASPTSLRP